MKTSMATVSLSGNLGDKLKAIAQAEFELGRSIAAFGKVAQRWQIRVGRAGPG